MPKRRGEAGGDCSSKPRLQHLYLVFDDWHCGYSIRKVRLFSGSREGGMKRLPQALMRMVAPRGFPKFFTSAFGPRIVLMHPGASEIAVPVVDVRTRSVMFGPETNYPAYPIYIPVGCDRLFTLDYNTFEFCCSMLEPDGGAPLEPQSDWSWSRLPVQPFVSLDVSSYAVYKEETIFVSTMGGATFAFDIGQSVWKLHGEWALPFSGRGYFDRELDAIVGLSKDPETLGHIYSCYVTSHNTGIMCRSPDWKCSKEKVFNKNPTERHVGATLVYRRRSKFCVVECVCIDDVRADQVQELKGVLGGGYMYRVITFTLRYDRMGDLRVRRYRVHCYKVPGEATAKFVQADPVAFWL